MLKKYLVLPLILLSVFGYPQSAIVKQINQVITPGEALEPLRYLASDELKGRSTRRPEIEIAAKYIADFFRQSNVKSLQEAQDYFQRFELKGVTPPADGSLRVNDSVFAVGKRLLQIGGGDVSLDAPIIYIGYGNDLSAYNISGKIVLTDAGTSDSSTF